MLRFGVTALTAALSVVSMSALADQSVQGPLTTASGQVAVPAQKAKSINVQSNIVLDVIGAANLNVNFRLGKAFVAGPTLTYMTFSTNDGGQSSSSTVTSFGAQAEYAFNGDVMSDGLLFNPFVSYNSVSNKVYNIIYTYYTFHVIIYFYKIYHLIYFLYFHEYYQLLYNFFYLVYND